MSLPALPFPAPTDIGEILRLLNNDTKRRLSLLDSDGDVYGYYREQYGEQHISVSGKIEVVDGTVEDGHVIFITETPEVALGFLYGLFYGAFGGKDLEDIHDAIVREGAQNL